MATNKNAQLRYKALDACFSHQYKRFFMPDLIEYCSQILSDHYVKESSVSRRQIFIDIDFMKSDAGFQAPIEAYKDGRKVYYRYSEGDFSILKKPLSPAELEGLNHALETLSRMNNLPGFAWANSLQTKLKSGLNLNNEPRKIISFEENQFLKGLEFLNDLYQYTGQQQSLKIYYHSFNAQQENSFIISPYYLKQYNNRWFLFGWNHLLNKLQNLALDRITKLEVTNEAYVPSAINFEDYFEDIVGVTHQQNHQIEEVCLRLSDNILPYIKSKPLHGSQKIKDNILSLQLKINYELESMILSYGPNMEVLSPKSLYESIKAKVKQMHDFY